MTSEDGEMWKVVKKIERKELANQLREMATQLIKSPEGT